MQTLPNTRHQRRFFLEIWRVTRPVSPSSFNLVSRPYRKTLASADTSVAFSKKAALVLFLDGGSAILLFEGTVASQVNEWTRASHSAKYPANKSTVQFSDEPLRKKMVPSLSTKTKHLWFSEHSFHSMKANTAARVSVSNTICCFLLSRKCRTHVCQQAVKRIVWVLGDKGLRPSRQASIHHHGRNKHR